MPKKSKKRKVVSGVEKEIKEALKESRLVIGTRVVLKGLKKGGIQKVICASNCPAASMKDLEQYSKNVKGIETFGGNSAELGEICGKPFKALTVGIKK